METSQLKKLFIMTQMGHIPQQNKLVILCFMFLQILILLFSFTSYVNIIEGIYYYSEAVVIWCSLYTLINYILLIIFTKKYFNKYFYFAILSLSFLSVFGTSSIIKQKIDFIAIASVIFLVSTLISFFLLLKIGIVDKK